MNQMPPGVVFHYCSLLNATIGGGGGRQIRRFSENSQD